MEDFLVGTTGLIVVIIVIIWGVLSLFAPFFWYGTNKRCKEISEKMDELIEIQRRALFQREPSNDRSEDSGIVPRR
jgi:hypothetical protein